MFSTSTKLIKNKTNSRILKANLSELKSHSSDAKKFSSVSSLVFLHLKPDFKYTRMWVLSRYDWVVLRLTLQLTGKISLQVGLQLKFAFWIRP